MKTINPKLRFKSYVGIDYSGAATSQSRTPALQVYRTIQACTPELVRASSSTESKHRNWNRSEVSEWLETFLTQNDAVIVGIDHGFSFPKSYFDRYQLNSWDEFLDDFVHHWPTHQPQATVEKLRGNSKRSGNARELRLTERWTASAKSVFQFDVQGSVAKSTHAGLPYIHRIRKLFPHIHFWPFDGWQVPLGANVISEIWPTVFRHRYPAESRSVDQQDAYSVCRWLNDMDSLGQLGRFFNPPLTDSEREVANLEGWILGIM
jgi:hypothetical protein